MPLKHRGSFETVYTDPGLRVYGGKRQWSRGEEETASSVLSLYRLYKRRFRSCMGSSPACERSQRLHTLMLPASHQLIAYGTFNIVLHIAVGCSNGVTGSAYTFLTLTGAVFLISIGSFGAEYLLQKHTVAYYGLASLILINSVLLPMALWMQRNVYRETLAIHLFWIHLLSGYNFFFLILASALALVLLFILFLAIDMGDNLFHTYLAKAAEVGASLTAREIAVGLSRRRLASAALFYAMHDLHDSHASLQQLPSSMCQSNPMLCRSSPVIPADTIYGWSQAEDSARRLHRLDEPTNWDMFSMNIGSINQISNNWSWVAEASYSLPKSISEHQEDSEPELISQDSDTFVTLSTTAPEMQKDTFLKKLIDSPKDRFANEKSPGLWHNNGKPGGRTNSIIEMNEVFNTIVRNFSAERLWSNSQDHRRGNQLNLAAKFLSQRIFTSSNSLSLSTQSAHSTTEPVHSAQPTQPASNTSPGDMRKGLRGTPPPSSHRQLQNDTEAAVTSDQVALLSIADYKSLLGFPTFWDTGSLCVFLGFGMLIYHLIYIFSFIILQSHLSLLFWENSNLWLLWKELWFDLRLMR
eukprot:Gregarina_sp_Poly_1__8980@NODE_545_length_7585_cov_19_130753_g432_i0_p2_GENE_NODE_545_length_7585_cov_19_130753_g432_i0NODE_545_length_7585_cov_19_130753_g432_i0_p2_ORF_typecomplete_len582_score62_08Tad/PF13400_6/3_7Tad/PF13400_6/2e03_NODE_545_length_7585_cov_19_130753_g432_i056107355